MKIMYIGRQPVHRDRLFGTHIRWNGPGDVQEVEPDEVAAKMLNQHPDVYTAAPDSKSAPAEAVPRPTEPEIVPPCGPEDIDEPAIDVDGHVVPLRLANKVQLEAYAKERFGVSLDRRRTQQALAEEVLRLIDELG